ncbi:MAG: tetratricopeptide repeat protein [Saprospiraceae bacterium]|nr:tetratricopeptide repeat protein [Saprospiraceae bacterium]
MRILLSTIALFVIQLSTQAQTNIDSLFAVWQDPSQSDSLRVDAFDEYIWEAYLFSDPDSAAILASQLIEFAKEKHFPKGHALGLNAIGISYDVRGNYPAALDYYQQSLEVFERMGDKNGTAGALGNIGIIFMGQGNYLKAIDHLTRSLKSFEQIGNKRGMANALANIGVIYEYQDDLEEALNYYTRGKTLHEEMGNLRGQAIALTSIGGVYSSKGEYGKALDCYIQSLGLVTQFEDNQMEANILANIANNYQNKKDYDKALDFHLQSLDIKEEIGDQKALAYTLFKIGNIYLEKQDYNKAIKYCERSYDNAKAIEVWEEQKSACQCLYDAYKAIGQSNKALLYMEQMRVAEDSLQSAATSKKLQEMEFAKQVLVDSLAAVEKERQMEEAHKEEVRKKNQTRNMLAGGGLLLLILAGGIYSRLRFTRRAKAIIEKEKDRSENLLLNILPADIAAELKEKGRADARDFETVSILFTDFKGFTAASEKLTAHELVSEINACFEAFDGIIGKYGIEKIKTIGDSYMAAGGLPVPSDTAVKNTVLAALEMQDFIKKRKVKLDASHTPCFEMRVGIHTGPVVAGIVGVKKFAYDIWGDTVNTASRMESSGAVGQVNISQSTYELLKDDPDFKFENRGKVQAKGKGEMEMYFVSKN